MNALSKDSPHQQALRDFIAWALEMLGIDFTNEEELGGTIRLDDEDPDRFGEKSEIAFSWKDELSDGREPMAYGTALFSWLLNRLQAGGAFHARPAEQPERVHQITDVLFPAYQIEGGSIRLSGCTLEEKPLVRLSYYRRQQPAVLRHLFLSTNGQAIDECLVECLGLDSLVNYSDKPPHGVSEQVETWVSTCVAAAEKEEPADSPWGDLAATAIIWCKYAEGKLTVSIEDQTADIAFTGFAKAIAKGVIPPPPFTCSESGDQSFQITATEDGIITTVGSIVACHQSGKKTIKSRLHECAATHKLVLPEFLVSCPASGAMILESAIISCPTCRQRVSPTSIRGAKCETCRSLKSAFVDDARLARVLGEYPRLDQWRSWQIGESTNDYVIIASGLFKKLLLVVNKEQLHVDHMATAGLISGWSQVPEANRSEYLD
ncbi:MAG: hypothetical protein ACI9G1_002623 [Pirellulaceae bacterium]